MKKLLIMTVLAMFVASTAMAATYTVRVSKLATSGDNYEDIMVVPNDLVLSPGDAVEVVVDSNIWCPGDDASGLGTVDIEVPANTAGFTATTYTVTENDPHGDQTQAIAGTPDADIETVIVAITLTDNDCTAETQGANVVDLRLYCNRDVPTLSEWGLIIFSLLILTLITVVMTRRKRAAAQA